MPSSKITTFNSMHTSCSLYFLPGPFECAFGGPVNHLAFTLTDPSKDTDLGESLCDDGCVLWCSGN